MKVAKVITILILIAVLGVGAYFLLVNTNNLSNDFETFYVENNGKRVSQTYDVCYERGETLKFDVKYTFGFLSDQKGYTVKVIANKNTDVEYVIDGRYYYFAALADISSAFEIEKSDNYFTLTIPNDFSIKTVLDTIYPSSNVEIDESFISSDEAFYTLQIKSSDGKSVVNIDFGVIPGPTGISLDQTRIIF